MKKVMLILSIVVFNSQSEVVIFDARNEANNGSWYSLNDDVMGGVSRSQTLISKEGFLIFKGEVSTANNGGFAMIQMNKSINRTQEFSHIRIHLKGDGKKYQFRIKPNVYNRYSYVNTFKTSGEKENIDLKLADFKPMFRGVNLNRPNFQSNSIEQIGILIGNKKNESFELHIEKIELIKL